MSIVTAALLAMCVLVAENVPRLLLLLLLPL
jgi:hypothetical protein